MKIDAVVRAVEYKDHEVHVTLWLLEHKDGMLQAAMAALVPRTRVTLETAQGETFPYTR